MARPQPRVPAIPVERLSAEARGLIGNWTQLNFSRVIVNHPAAYGTFVPYLAQLIKYSKLPPRERELVCLRTLVMCGDTYELTHHKTIARNGDMSDAEIDAACEGRGESLQPFDRVVIAATEELVRDQFIRDETWSRLAERYSVEQIMDLVFLCGCYVTMAMVTRSFDIQLEEESVREQINAARTYV